MTEERKNEIIKAMAYKSKEELLTLLELYLMNTTKNHTEEYEYVLQSIKNEILSRMSM